MQVQTRTHQRFLCELRREADLTEVPIASKDVTEDVKDLVEEGVANLILAGRLPPDAENVEAQVNAVCKEAPLVDKIEIGFSAGNGTHRQEFTGGRWEQWSQEQVLQLREEGTVGQDEPVFRMILAPRRTDSVPLTMPELFPPPIVDGTLEECGVRGLADGEFTPDRPVLVNSRMHEDAIVRCEQAGTIETGAAVAGRYVRLPETLPGTVTPIVTVFSCLLFDPRHVGDTSRFHYDPHGLAEAQQLCDLRGLGEGVVSVWHSHGWGCGACNQKAGCPLAESVPSLQDYQMLESLFPGKCALLPITGRKLGAEGRRPVLQLYAWRRGRLRPIRFRGYQD